MPLRIYAKEQILDACLAVFARHGYKDTSTGVLAEAAGISKALIFHHFKSKKELYLSVLARCFEKTRSEVGVDPLLEYSNFFEAKKKYSFIKLDYIKKNLDVYKVLIEAFIKTPDEVKADIEVRYGQMIAGRDKVWKQLFERVPLREGVDRGQAFELIKITLDHFETKFLSELTDESDVDETYFRRFIEKRNSFLAMIRYGIEK